MSCWQTVKHFLRVSRRSLASLLTFIPGLLGFGRSLSRSGGSWSGLCRVLSWPIRRERVKFFTDGLYDLRCGPLLAVGWVLWHDDLFGFELAGCRAKSYQNDRFTKLEGKMSGSAVIFGGKSTPMLLIIDGMFVLSNLPNLTFNSSTLNSQPATIRSDCALPKL